MVGDILQPTHLLFVLIVALVVLGPKRLPEVARTLGNGLRDFKNAINGERHDPDHHRDEHDDPYAGDADPEASAQASGSNGAEPEQAAPTPRPAEPA